MGCSPAPPRPREGQRKRQPIGPAPDRRGAVLTSVVVRRPGLARRRPLHPEGSGQRRSTSLPCPASLFGHPSACRINPIAGGSRTGWSGPPSGSAVLVHPSASASGPPTTTRVTLDEVELLGPPLLHGIIRLRTPVGMRVRTRDVDGRQRSRLPRRRPRRHGVTRRPDNRPCRSRRGP